MSIASKLLNPKSIILNAINQRLEGTGITKLVFVFNIKTDKYNVMFTQSDGKGSHFDIEDNEIKMLKNIFVNKIYRKFQEKSDKEIQSIIIQIELETDEIEIFIQDMKNEVELFEYNF